MQRATLIIGASTKPERYSFKAINKLLEYKHPVFAIGNREGMVQSIPILTGFPGFTNIHTISLYINSQLQKQYYAYILNTIKPKRVIFNPGTENDELVKMLEDNQIEAVVGCTLVMLSTAQF